jgi:hypothetical protein
MKFPSRIIGKPIDKLEFDKGGCFMKKYFSVILTLIVMFSLAGCSTHQPNSQETSSAISETKDIQEPSSAVSETKDISEYLIEKNGWQYLILPISQSEIKVGDDYKQHLNDIDIELLKTAEKIISDKMSAYTEPHIFYLMLDKSGHLCLGAESIVDIEPPNVVTDDSGEIFDMGGCNIDHKHIFFHERITK